MSTDTDNIVASANGGSAIQKFFAMYVQEACATAFAGTDFVVGTPILDERAETEGWVVNEFVRIPVTIAKGKEGRSLSLVFMVGTVKGPSHPPHYPLEEDSFRVFGPIVEGLENGNVLVKFGERWGSGRAAWETKEGLSVEAFLRHYNCVGGISAGVWDFVRNQGKKFLSGELAFGMSKSQIVRTAAHAIGASGIRLPWNAASWGPTMGRKNEEVVLDVEATGLAHNLSEWLSAFNPKALDPEDVAYLRFVLERCSGPGMNSPLTTVNVWDVVRAFENPWDADNALAELRDEAEMLLEPHGLEPMVSALGENLLRTTEPALRKIFLENEASGRRNELLKLAAQRVADATLAQVAKKKASAA